MAILKCLLLILSLVRYASSVTFNFTDISLHKDMFIFISDANISADGIQLTPERRRPGQTWYSGRATYINKLHLWDKSSSELAGFSTSFSFVIDSYPQRVYADGLTFFLAEDNGVALYAGALGLPYDTTHNVTISPFVAVEFDTFGLNGYDNHSFNDHVGIDVNNLSSVRISEWQTDIPNGRQCQAWIQYDSDSKNLSVSFTNIRDSNVVRQNGLYYNIDLRDVLPEWVIFGFSAATSADSFQKNIVKSWIFNSSDLKVDKNKVLTPNTRNGKNKIRPHVVGLLAGVAVLVTFLVTLAFVLWRKNKNYEGEVEELRFTVEMNNEFEMQATGPRRFSYAELARSTAGFSEKEMLGEGGFGGVYKGFLKDSSTYVAVKRISKSSKQGMKEYASEVRIISRLRHKNLVQLTGWCHQRGELLLVYEFMENGSLDLHLFKGKSLLTWGTRHKIAHGLASALLYLHEEWTQCVLHRDIKSSNLMLDSNFNAKLGDFGLAKLVDHEKGHKTTVAAGTMGYMAPECVATGKASKDSDVFSFGIVALEIASGRKPIDYKAKKENQIYLVEWVWELYGVDGLLEAIDPHLGSDFVEEEIKRLMIVGLWCAHPDSKHRPSIRQAIQVLNCEASLPVLPSEMPVASYNIPDAISRDLSKQAVSSTPPSYLLGR
uniref:L-type lectin-domain containing receptor kinase IX.1-like n=1 Tax=Erigeron canadensis TaxID=72917 RepID=UPI001CB892A1|nr:L-type lectin-domain containing receptor kinase IX.1-like [Erigeron canadensis]